MNSRYRNGKLLNIDGQQLKTKIKDGHYTLVLKAAEKTDTGLYSLKVSDQFKEVETSATVTVHQGKQSDLSGVT